MNRALLVLVNSSINVSLWGYGTRIAPHIEVNTRGADWYFMWLKYEFNIGLLEPQDTRVVELRVIPMASYAPGLEGLYLEMAKHINNLKGRDFSYALNTGTGAFQGLVEAARIIAEERPDLASFVQLVIDSAGKTMRLANWKVGTRVLSNYVISLVKLYEFTNDSRYLEWAEDAAEHILHSQIRNTSDPRNGGFLDAPPPYGLKTYLDVNAEAARALWELYKASGNETYMESYEYWAGNWFYRDPSTGRWYYGYSASVDEGYSYRYLDDALPYALGYLLQALTPEYWSSEIALLSASRLWSLLNGTLWIPAVPGAESSNVETQSSTALGLKGLLDAMINATGMGIEYAGGCQPSHISLEPTGEESDQAVLEIKLLGEEGGLTIVYLGRVNVLNISLNGTTLAQAAGLEGSKKRVEPGYYWTNGSLLFIELARCGKLEITYEHAGSTEGEASQKSTPREAGAGLTSPTSLSHLYPTAALVISLLAVVIIILYLGKRRHIVYSRW